MGTISKSVRIDDKFFPLVEEYVSLMKGIYGNAPSVNSVLNSSMILGFEQILTPLSILNNGSFKADEDFINKFNSKYKFRCQELIKKFRNYKAYLESDDCSTIEEE